MTLKVVGADPKINFNSDMLLYMQFKVLSKFGYRGFAPEPYSRTPWVDLLTLFGPNMWEQITILSSYK